MSGLHVLDFEAASLVYDSNSRYLFAVEPLVAEVLRDASASPSPDDEAESRARLQAEKLREISRLCGTRGLEPPPPRSRRLSALWLNVSHACNMSCAYCFADGGSYGRAELMGRETAERAVDFLLSQGTPDARLRIVFFGGEPLVNFPVLKACVAYAEQRSSEEGVAIDFHLITNGTLVTREVARYLRRHGITVQLSIDGAADEHDRLRQYRDGSGTYTRVVDGLRTLEEAGILDVRARVTVTHLNCEVAGIARHLRELGFSKVALIPVMSDPADPFALSDADLACVKDGYRDLAEGIIAQLRSTGEADLDVFGQFVAQAEGGQRKRFFCGAGFGSLTVTPRGRLFPCHRLAADEGMEIGSLEQGVEVPPHLDTWGVASVDDREPCRSCWARYFCGGGCAVNALENNGDWMMPEPSECEIMKEVVENALRISYAIKTMTGGQPRLPDSGAEPTPAEVSAELC